MSSFTTRVELHNATWSDYESLHEQMRKQGFGRTIQSGDGTVYELPPAEYNLVANLTRDNVLERAKTAAAAIKKSAAFLVTESVGRTWQGLDRA